MNLCTTRQALSQEQIWRKLKTSNPGASGAGSGVGGAGAGGGYVIKCIAWNLVHLASDLEQLPPNAIVESSLEAGGHVDWRVLSCLAVCQCFACSAGLLRLCTCFESHCIYSFGTFLDPAFKKNWSILPSGERPPSHQNVVHQCNVPLHRATTVWHIITTAARSIATIYHGPAHYSIFCREERIRKNVYCTVHAKTF